MSNVHVEMIEDQQGDLIDMLYWHHNCAPTDNKHVKEWPAPEALDYMVYCEGCGYVIHEIPLTAYGKAEYSQSKAY